MSEKQADKLFELFRALELPPEMSAEALAGRVTAQVREEREAQAARTERDRQVSGQEESRLPRRYWLWGLLGAAIIFCLTASLMTGLAFVFKDQVMAVLDPSETPQTPAATTSLPTATLTDSPTTAPDNPPPTGTDIPSTITIPENTPTVVPAGTAAESPTAIPLTCPPQVESAEQCAQDINLEIECSPADPVLGQVITCSAIPGDPETSAYAWLGLYDQDQEFLPWFSDGDGEPPGNAAHFSFPFAGEYTVQAAILVPACSDSLAFIRTFGVTVAPGESAQVTWDEGAPVQPTPANDPGNVLATLVKDDYVAVVPGAQEGGGDNWKFRQIYWSTLEGKAWLRHYDAENNQPHAVIVPDDPPHCQDLRSTSWEPAGREASILDEALLHDGCGRIVGKVVYEDLENPEEDAKVMVIAEGVDWAWIRILDRNLFVKPEQLQ